MKQVTISSKNQITIPASMLRNRRLTGGKKLYITESGSDIILTTKQPLERYLHQASIIKAKGAPKKPLLDPIKARQELRENWE